MPAAPAMQSRTIDVVPTNGTRVEAQAGKLLTLSFRVSNKSSAKKKVESFVHAPAGWRRLVKDAPFELEGGASDIRLLSISIPSETPAAEYSVRFGIRDASDPSDVSDASMTIVITAVKDQTLKLVESPRMAIAGETYVATFLLTNKGNVATPVRLSAQSSNRFVATVDSSMVHLKPGESRTFNVKVQTEAKIPSKVQDILDIAAELDSANIAHATSFVEVVPRITGDEYQFITFPLGVTARFTGQQGRNGAQIEVAGAGSLAEKGGGALDVLIRTPDNQSKSVLGQRDEYRIGYTTKQYSVFVGDNNFSLSPLTEFNRYAFGASGAATMNDITAGAFYNKMRFGAPNQQEWAGFLTYHASEKASIGVNYLGREEQYPSSIFSVRALLQPFKANEVDLEYGVGGIGNQPDRAYAARWSARESWISYDAQYLHAGPSYTGYYRDVDFKNVSLNVLPFEDLRVEAYYRDEYRNLKRDSTLLLALHNRYILVGGGYSSLVSVYYRVNDQEDLLPVSHFRRGDKTWLLRLSQNLAGIMLVGNADAGTTRDDLLGHSSQYQRYGISASAQLFPGHTYGITADYTRQNDLTTMEPQQLLEGSVNATILMSEGTQISAALFGTKTRGGFNQTYSLFDASIVHGFAGGQSITLRGRQSIFAPSIQGKEIAYLAELSIPVNVPIARKTETGRLTGKVVDSEKGTGIQGVLVYAGGATALTDRNGEYHFVSLKSDKYYVQLDMASIGLNRVASQQLPHEVTIVGGQEARYDISLTRSIGVSGVVRLFGMQEQAYGDTSQPQMIDKGGHPNVILELSNPLESIRRVSDNRGRFSFVGIRPGHWTLRILDGNLPENHYFEKETYEYDVAPGQSVEQTFKVLPRKRRIQIIVQGKTIENVPAKGKAAPAAQEKVETAPKEVVQKPAIIPSAPSVKPGQVRCTVAFVPERRVFVIEYSTRSTKALADSEAAHIAKMTDLPASVKIVRENKRMSYVVTLGSFKTRTAAEKACERIRNLR